MQRRYGDIYELHLTKMWRTENILNNDGKTHYGIFHKQDIRNDRLAFISSKIYMFILIGNYVEFP